eukprot:2686705-Alexandrium_andersonii.AAC.1
MCRQCCALFWAVPSAHGQWRKNAFERTAGSTLATRGGRLQLSFCFLGSCWQAEHCLTALYTSVAVRLGVAPDPSRHAPIANRRGAHQGGSASTPEAPLGRAWGAEPPLLG